MELRIFPFLVLLSRISLIRCQHPAICFAQSLKSSMIVEPISYSESDTLSLVTRSTIQPPIAIRCACPNSHDLAQVQIQPGDGTVADPKICQDPVRAVVYYAAESPNQVRTYYIGFEIWEPGLKRTEFVPVVELTFNMPMLTPVYAKYRYRSPVLNYLVFWSSRQYVRHHEFLDVNIFGEENIDSLYSIENQLQVFSPFLNDSYYKKIFHPEKPILVKQQLAQPLDFLLDTWKEVTYFNVNTAPMFVAVQKTWMKIEAFVVKVAKALYRDLFITTGVSMVKNLINSKMKAIPIYLNNTGTKQTKPVPNIFWKILQYTYVDDNEANKYGLLVVMHNDPLFKRQETICTNIESVVQWQELMDDDDEDQQSRNIAYICELNEENLRKLKLPISLPVVENFLDVKKLQERFGIGNPDRAPVYRFV